MLNFPPISYAFLAIPFVILAFLAIAYIIYKYLKSNGIDNLFTVLILGFISLLAVSCGAFFSITHSLYVYEFRSIEISKVSGFRIYPSKNESSFTKNNYRDFHDKKAISKILESLKECTEFNPNHESFENGYKINLIFDDESYRNDLYISVFRKSTRENGKTSVMPHVTSHQSVNLGNYHCPTLQKLTRKYIDPLFEKEKISPKP